jgi:hypothetical protein
VINRSQVQDGPAPRQGETPQLAATDRVAIETLVTEVEDEYVRTPNGWRISRRRVRHVADA